MESSIKFDTVKSGWSIVNTEDLRIEKSIPRIDVLHHEACQVTTNGDPQGRIFLSYPHTNNGLFFLAHHCFYFFYLF